MMRIFAALLILGLMFRNATPSFADTDYACLSSCMNNGGNSMTCMQKCTYDSTKSAAGPAMPAHTDYTCLKACVDGGLTPSVCMPQCTSLDTQSSASAPAAVARAPAATHNQFHAPVPTDGIVLSAPNRPAMPVAKDYNCINLCMQGGMQYQLCSQRCTK